AAVDLALAQPAPDDLLAHVLAEAREARAVTLDALAQLRDRQPVFLRDRAERLVDLGVVDANAGVARRLQLRAVDDHALENLLLERVGRRRLDVLGPKLSLCDLHAQGQLAGGDR